MKSEKEAKSAKREKGKMARPTGPSLVATAEAGGNTNETERRKCKGGEHPETSRQ